MKVIGLTGGIGSGKSTVAELLAGLGAKVIDADKVAHEVFDPETEGLKEVAAAFGEKVLQENGEIDRNRLAEIVFNDPEALEKLNRIVHPRAYELTRSRLEEYRRQGVEVVVLEVILLVEAGWAHLADTIWVTVASEESVVKRLKQTRGMSEEEILSRIHSQTSNAERIKNADVVINNDGDLGNLKAQVMENWENIGK